MKTLTSRVIHNASTPALELLDDSRCKRVGRLVYVRFLNLTRYIRSALHTASARAMAGNAPRHRWHSRQRRCFRICKLQNLKEAGKFESHSLRQSNTVHSEDIGNRSRVASLAPAGAAGAGASPNHGRSRSIFASIANLNEN